MYIHVHNYVHTMVTVYMYISRSTSGGSQRNGRTSESPLPPSAAVPQTQSQQQLQQMEAADVPKKLFNPFCSVDGMQLSIHCHINAVRTLVCVPGQVPKDRESSSQSVIVHVT